MLPGEWIRAQESQEGSPDTRRSIGKSQLLDFENEISAVISWLSSNISNDHSESPALEIV